MLYVETHWILSCVLNQEPAAPALLGPANDLRIGMPAFCISEAIARFRTLLEHAVRHHASTSAFLTGNTRDFGSSTPAGQELSRAKIKVFSKVGAALGFLSATTVSR